MDCNMILVSHSLNTIQACWLCAKFPSAEGIFLSWNSAKRFWSNKALSRRPDFIVLSVLCFSNQTNKPNCELNVWQALPLPFPKLFFSCCAISSFEHKFEIYRVAQHHMRNFPTYFIESPDLTSDEEKNAFRCKILLMVFYVSTHR